MTVKPYVGAIVHYVKYNLLMSGPEHLAALVVDVKPNGRVDLSLFPAPDSLSGVCDVLQSQDDRRPGTWHWIETVEQYVEGEKPSAV